MWIRARAIASRSSARSRRSRARCAMSASTRMPDRGHARDPHHVVGAQLHPVERVRDRGARAREVAPAPEQLGLQRPERSDPLRLRGLRDERLDRLEAARPPSPRPRPRAPARLRGCGGRSGAGRRAGPVGRRGTRARPSSPRPRTPGPTRSATSSREAAARGRTPRRVPPWPSRAPRSCARRGSACRPGSRTPCHVPSTSSFSRAISIARRRDAIPSSMYPATIPAMPSVFRTSLSERRSPAATAVVSASRPSLQSLAVAAAQVTHPRGPGERSTRARG